jgi:hypothetical protein
MQVPRVQTKTLLLSLGSLLVLIGLVTALAPIERTLGTRARLVYFHGAWVWSGKVAFAAAAISGLAGLALPLGSARKWGLQRASVALAWVGMFFWLTYLPLSLVVQQMNWGGIFWEEPRWRVPLAFGIVGTLLQAGLFLIEDLRLASGANGVFGAALWWFLGNIENVMHPDSPIFQSDAVTIQVFFAGLVLLSVLFGALLAALLYRIVPDHWK